MKSLLMHNAAVAFAFLGLWTLLDVLQLELSSFICVVALVLLPFAFYAASMLALPEDFRWAQALSVVLALLFSALVFVVALNVSYAIHGGT